jgi:hypothetical protein
LSIWIKDTLKLRDQLRTRFRLQHIVAHVRYAVLLRMSDPENKTPMGNIDLR